MEKIIAHTPRRQRAKAREFMQKFDCLQAVMGEVCTPEPWALPNCNAPPSPGSPLPTDATDPTPVVLFSRYRDNIYIASINVPSHLREDVRTAVAAVLGAIYKIPLKWEPHGECVVWGEAEVSRNAHSLSLTRKAIKCLSPPSVDTPVEWTRWVHRRSPNA